jgi:hypothetical protein
VKTLEIFSKLENYLFGLVKIILFESEVNDFKVLQELQQPLIQGNSSPINPEFQSSRNYYKLLREVETKESPILLYSADKYAGTNTLII